VSLEEAVMQCGAPALCGIKPSCLFSVSKDMFERGKVQDWSRAFRDDGKYILALPERDGRMLFFVYDKPLLLKQCTTCSVQKYLRRKHYPVDSGFNAVFAELLHRLAADCTFPHEVGVFLGYPLSDVEAFERTAGSGYRYSGFWKVYGNVGRAQKRMQLYKTCSAECSRLVRTGMPVPAAAKKYAAALAK
jgi:hypothetical protein